MTHPRPRAAKRRPLTLPEQGQKSHAWLLYITEGAIANLEGTVAKSDGLTQREIRLTRDALAKLTFLSLHIRERMKKGFTNFRG